MATFTWTDNSEYTSGTKNQFIQSWPIAGTAGSNLPRFSTISKVTFSVQSKQNLSLSSGNIQAFLSFFKDDITGDDVVQILSLQKNAVKNSYQTFSSDVTQFFQTTGANCGLPKAISSSEYGLLSPGYIVTDNHATVVRKHSVKNVSLKFEYNDQYNISTNVSPSGYGSVSGGGTKTAGTTITLTANPATGYEFTQWSDGNTSNPRNVLVTGNATFTAEFKPQKIEVSVGWELLNPNAWSEEDRNYVLDYCKNIVVSGSGTYDYGSTINLKCENLPKKAIFSLWNGYEMDSSYNNKIGNWSNSSTSIQIGEQFLYSNSNTAFKKVKIIATIGFENCYVTKIISPYAEAGDICLISDQGYELSIQDGEGFVFGRHFTFRAKSLNEKKYNFTSWGDGITDSDIRIRITDDFILTAYFEKRLYNVSVSANPLEGGTIRLFLRDGTEVTGKTKFEYDTFIEFIITPNEGYLIDTPGGITSSLIVTGDFTDEIFFEKIKYTLNISISPSEGGEVIGEREYEYGDTVRLEAIPALGYKFNQWSLGKTNYYEPVLTYKIEGITGNTIQKITVNFERLKPKFKSVKIYYPSENDIASPTNPLVSGEKAQIVVQVALE